MMSSQGNALHDLSADTLHLALPQEENKKLKSKQREKMQPKMGKLDIDYQVLHDAFFKFQTKPQLTVMGDLYYEGKEYEARVRPACSPTSPLSTLILLSLKLSRGMLHTSKYTKSQRSKWSLWSSPLARSAQPNTIVYNRIHFISKNSKFRSLSWSLWRS